MIIYEKYIDRLLQCLNKTNDHLGRSLLRGWKGYKKSMQKYIKLSVKEESIKRNQKEIGVQCVVDEAIEPPQNPDIDIYLNSLHRVIKGMNHMHIGKIINKLDDLTRNLKTVDVPSPSTSPEVETLDFTDTMKSIHTKLKASIKHKKKESGKKILIKTFVNKESQTLLKHEEIKIMESMKIIIVDKDTVINDLHGKLRKKDEDEEALNRKVRECEEMKNTIQDLQASSCLQCKAKKEKIEADMVEIRNLQVSVYKSIGVEKELEITKTKLKETTNYVTVQNSKIIELEDNIDDLNKRIEEVKAQREALVRKLNKEYSLRESVESQLADEMNQCKFLKKVIEQASSPQKSKLESSPQKSKLESSPEKPKKNTNKIDIEYLSQTKVPSFNLSKNITKTPQAQKIFDSKISNTSPDIHDNYNSDPKKSFLVRDSIRGAFTGRVGSAQRLTKKNKGNTIMGALKMTKEEYLQLSKKARIELYECLYEHKEKCGSECEHLKRAMMIRYKDKGLLLPMKKYNIT